MAAVTVVPPILSRKYPEFGRANVCEQNKLSSPPLVWVIAGRDVDLAEFVVWDGRDGR